MYRHGWFMVAFEEDVGEGVTPSQIGTIRLLLVRTGGEIRAFGADCPHRGAHLGMGGKLEGDCIVCPFHGYPIALGKDSSRVFSTPMYPTLVFGGMVLVRLSESHENGLTACLERLAEDHAFVRGFEMEVRTRPDIIIENGFDRRHFHSVHGIRTLDFEVRRSEAGALIVDSTFFVPSTEKFKGESGELAAVPYRATTISPGLVIVELGGDNPYAILTGTTETGPLKARIRIVLLLPKWVYGLEPREEHYRYLLLHSRRGLEEDKRMWENLSDEAPQRLTAEDDPVLLFHSFCKEFQGRNERVQAGSTAGQT